MDSFIYGELKVFIQKSFTTNEGETVEYNEAYFLTEDDGQQSLVKVNTKQDLNAMIGKTGTVKLRTSAEGKTKLISFVIGGKPSMYRETAKE